jgi:formylglycine-generating enzyme required for sulfatase activity
VNQAACDGDTPVCTEGECAACTDGEARGCADCTDTGSQTCVDGVWGTCEYGRAACINTPPCKGESCCRGMSVEGDTFLRGVTTESPATVSDFCLDKYEVTVGRFREFLAAYDDWTPSANEGEHRTGAGTGWLSDWNKGDELPLNTADFREALKCHESYATWRDTPGTSDQENLPQTCINWYESFAFCIWDGGRLATEAEWEYASVGGAEERPYPWGNEIPSSNHALFDCTGDGSPAGECSLSDLLPVGSRQPEGNGRWGHSDLAGSVWEWLFDYSGSYVSPCSDCAQTEPTETGYRLDRSGAWLNPGASLNPTLRSAIAPDTRFYYHGTRCVRTLPSP